MFWHLKELGLESVAILKRSSKVYYRYRGRNYSIKALYQRLLNSKRPAGQSYLYSSIVEANFQGQVFPVKIVFVAKNKSQIQSYDGQVAQITVTAMTYILLAWQERLNKDDRTLGDLFYLMNDSLPEIKFIEALVYLLKIFQSQEAGFISQTINQFLAYLPHNVQNILQKVV